MATVCASALSLVDAGVPLKHMVAGISCGTVLVFRQDFALENAIGSHACSLEANMRVTNGIPLRESTALTVVIINHAETLKVFSQKRFTTMRVVLGTNGSILPSTRSSQI
jgi:hypothetical protein